MRIEELIKLKETEHKIEFKEAKGGNFSYNGGSKPTPQERRRCILGYVSAFANEGGGYLVFGINDKYPHQVVGTRQCIENVGRLEQDIYRDLKIRVQIQELYDESGKRVLLIAIPPRPVGKVYKFEDVPLMRVGEELIPMDERQYLKIVQEQEPDFSAKVCSGLSFNDLDENAIHKLKEAYSKKQDNLQFLSQSNEQALSDLDLIYGNNITFAALILVGKESAIAKHLPQSKINLEYRNSLTQINFDNRQIFSESYFLTIDKLWDAINQRNGRFPIQQGPFIFDIPFFNKEVIREAINNAVAHRDYMRNSETVIKQFPNELHVVNAGGFPPGVTLQNLLTVNSTPRNRLLSDVMAKTGIVERSGQGIDKIYYQSLSEAKPEPDYSKSDDFQVELRLSSIVQDKAFALFIHQIQQNRKNGEKLSVQEIITLNCIRRGDNLRNLDSLILKKMEKEGLLERVGKTNSQKFILAKDYYIFTGTEHEYSNQKPISDIQIAIILLKHIKEFEKGRMKDFEFLLKNLLSRAQVKYAVNKMVEAGLLDRVGEGKSTFYIAGIKLEKNEKILDRAVELGLKEMKRLGETTDF
ncbi:MAG: putative DNA binding domain-containing protein [Bacteroidetes bacterium]|nr:putative DNA binding domain-containing protein [Bacteroidota bacterium]